MVKFLRASKLALLLGSCLYLLACQNSDTPPVAEPPKVQASASEPVDLTQMCENIQHNMQQIAKQAFAAIGGKGWSRVDFLRDEDGTLYLLELRCGFIKIEKPTSFIASCSPFLSSIFPLTGSL